MPLNGIKELHKRKGKEKMVHSRLLCCDGKDTKLKLRINLKMKRQTYSLSHAVIG